MLHATGAVKTYRKELEEELSHSDAESKEVIANMLDEIRHNCFSQRVVSRFAQRHLCGANLSWPYRTNLSASLNGSSAPVELDEPSPEEERATPASLITESPDRFIDSITRAH